MSCRAMATIMSTGKASVHHVSWCQSGRDGFVTVIVARYPFRLLDKGEVEVLTAAGPSGIETGHVLGKRLEETDQRVSLRNCSECFPLPEYQE
jgi:hypothetical protein